MSVKFYDDDDFEDLRNEWSNQCSPRWSDFLIGRLVKIWEEQRKYKKLDDVDEEDVLHVEEDGEWRWLALKC